MSSSIPWGLVLPLLLLWPGAALAQPVPDNRAVILITIGPGDEIYEKFGHNLILVHDPAAGTSMCYNWGLFSFDDPNFIANFVRGRMNYAMGAAPMAEVLPEYEFNGRRATFQRLALTPRQIDDLIARCETNLRPENRFYRYDYFTDNCSTRVRDMLDAVTGGQVRAELDGFKQPRPMTYRQHVLRLMQDEFWASLGMDFSLGPKCDRVLSAWDDAFLPMRLAEGISPLATWTRVPWRSDRPVDAPTWPDRTPLLAVVGLAVAAGTVAAGFAGRRDVRGFAYGATAVWWLIAGAGGMFLAGLWLWTDHRFAHANENLLHFSPIALVLLVLMAVQKRGVKAEPGGTGFQPVFASADASHSQRSRVGHGLKTRATNLLAGLQADRVPGVRSFLLRWGATGVLGVSLLATLAKAAGLLEQDNLRMILLALPLNIAAAWTAWRLTALRPADEVAAP